MQQRSRCSATATWYRRPDLLFGEIDYLDSLNKCVGLATRLLINENNPLKFLPGKNSIRKRLKGLSLYLTRQNG